jgi:hypothetical protein
MRAKLAAAAAVLLLAVAGIALLLHSSPRDPAAAAAPSLRAPEGSRSAALLAPRGPAAHFRGTVFYRGAPVAGAEVAAVPVLDAEAGDAGCDGVSLRLESLRAQTEPLARAQTAADGSFELSAGPPFRVVALAPSRGLVGQTLVGARAAEAEIAVELAPGQTVRGTLLGKGGGRITGAPVFAASGGLVLSTTADQGGGFEIGPLPAGPAIVAARSGDLIGFADVVGDRMGLLLGPATRLQVLVRRGSEPAPAAEVELASATCSSAGVADADGSIWFEEVVRQPIRVAARQGGQAAAVDATIDQPALRVVLALQPAVALEGRVRSEAGEPIPGAEVLIAPPRAPDDSPRPPTAYRPNALTTGADGRFALASLAVGPYQIEARADGFAPLRLPPRLLGPGRGEVELVLAPAASIRGRVTGASSPVTVEAWAVDLTSRVAPTTGTAAAATAGPDGSFELGGLARGPYTIRALGAGGWHQPIVVDAPSEGVEIALQPAAAVAGRVIDERGGPVAGASVRIRSITMRPGTMFDRRVSAGDDGAFAVDGLPPGDYDLSAEAGAGDAIRRAAQYLRVAGAQPIQVTLRLAGRAILAGRLRDASGEPVRGAAVAAFSASVEEHPPIVLYTHTDEEGHFGFQQVEDGAYLVSARGDSGVKSPPVTARAGDRSIELVLEEPATLTGRVIDDRGAPLAAFTIDGVLQNDPDGRFSLPMMTAGPQKILIAAPGRAPLLHRVRVRPGARRVLGDIVLGAPREIRGRVTESGSGEPIAGAHVFVARSLDQINNAAHGGGIDLLPTAVTDAAGEFTVSAPQGEVPLVVQHARYQQAVVEVVEGQDRADTALERGATVRGRVLDVAGRPLEASIFFDGPTPVMARSRADGSYEASGLSPGDYRVGARRPEGASWKLLPLRELAIESADQLTLDLREL